MGGHGVGRGTVGFTGDARLQELVGAKSLVVRDATIDASRTASTSPKILVSTTPRSPLICIRRKENLCYELLRVFVAAPSRMLFRTR
jgi:hypothetical protein